MIHEATINDLAQGQGLFSTIDRITVPETHPDTDNTQLVIVPFVPPPLIRRTERRDGTVWWIITASGVHERVFVADKAPITIYLKDVDPGRPTGHVHQPHAPAPQHQPAHQAPANWQPQPTYPAQQHAPAPQPAAPQRPAAPWSTNKPRS
ncbi:hypothetical protein [Streptomyces sp. NBC_00470]|uniref:hypothetical protein n=1 Tax=Streptomyces sp. NBC_00470 TaxID=2975753 RepID=UPI002F9071A8